MRTCFTALAKPFSLIGVCVLFLFIFWKTVPVLAADIQPDPVQVTATVQDIISPSTPILISPENSSKLKISTIPFVWKASTDNWLMDHYTLTVNNAVLFANIPLTATTNSQYTLTYDSTTEYYTLTPSQTFADGTYTWKITAWDYHENSADSAIWEFSIDTKAPDFVITKIEDTTVDISTTDAGSVPSDPIELKANEPTLSGTGEANSTVELTATYPDGSEHGQTFTIAGDGTWSVKLAELPRDGKILLDFLITDPTGNVSILTDVPLILYSPVVTIPVPPILAPIISSSPPPLIEVPVLPPTEYIPPVVKTVPRKVVYFVRNASATFHENATSILEKLAAAAAFLFLLPLPLVKFGILNLKYRNYLSRQLLKEFYWLIGPTPKQNPQGIVLSRDTMTPVPYALVLISGTIQTGEHITRTLITDNKGIIPFESLPEGEYRISIHHPQYFFPSLSHVPSHLSWNYFYTGASIKLKNGTALPALVIPVEPLNKQQTNLLEKLTERILSQSTLSAPIIFVCASVTMFFPSLINIVTTTICVLLYVKKEYWPPLPSTEVMVYDPQKKPVFGSVIIFKNESRDKLAAIQQTDHKGEALVKVPPDQYQLWCVDFQHRLTEGDNKTTTIIKTDKSKHYIPLVVEKI